MIGGAVIHIGSGSSQRVRARIELGRGATSPSESKLLRDSEDAIPPEAFIAETEVHGL